MSALWIAAALACAALLGGLQFASAAVFSRSASPFSLPAHLAPELGAAMYGRLERVLPLPFVESMLVHADIDRHDWTAAQHHVLRLPPSTARSEFLAQIALQRGDRAAATRDFLDAVDVDALRAEVERFTAAGDVRAAYALENATRERLGSTPTHPDLVAESFWRSGELAVRLHMTEAALADYRQALTLAPFSEKYLLAAGTQAVQLQRLRDARSYFERCLSVDPASADALAGLGLVALRRGDRATAQAYAQRSRAIDPHAEMLSSLERAMQ